MFGSGTVINAAAIVVGGIFGLLFGKKLKENHTDALNTVCGISVLFLGISGAMKGLLAVNDGQISAVRSMMLVLCMILGAVIGEIVDFESLFERFGEFLKPKTGNASDKGFVNAFVTTSFIVCIGAMAIIGALEDGINGDITILAEKSVLDLIMVMIMASTLGKGAVFSAIPVFFLQGTFTLLATLIEPILTAEAITNLGCVGNVLIFCVGLNILFGKKVKVANLLPALLFAVLAAYLPFSL